MTRQILFSALLVVSSGYAFVKGGRPEQIGAATLLGGAGLSVLAASPAIHRFENVETGILLTDLAILGIFLWLSLRSNRFWPMWVAAMLADLSIGEQSQHLHQTHPASTPDGTPCSPFRRWLYERRMTLARAVQAAQRGHVVPTPSGACRYCGVRAACPAAELGGGA